MRHLSAMVIYCGLFLATPVSLADDHEAAIQIPNAEALDAVLDQYVDGGHLPFVYARLEDRDGNLIYEHASASREFLPDTTIDGDTWIRIWSMSKAVTISIAMDLVEEGVIALDDPVTDHIPEFKDLKVAVTETGQPLFEASDESSGCPLKTVDVESVMTVRHLLNHQAGFFYAGSGFSCLDATLNEHGVAGATDRDDLVARLAAVPLIQQPGTGYHYGMNTTVLGLVAQRATNQSLEQLVRQRLTQRFGIEGLQYTLPDGVTLLPRYSGANGELRELGPSGSGYFGIGVPENGSPAANFGGEGMLGTADGYADFLRVLLNRGELDGKRLLDEETVAEMVAPHTQLNDDWGHNGYNIWVNSGKLSTGGFGRGGLWNVSGYEGTYGWVDPELGFVGVMMTQLINPSAIANQRQDAFREAVYDQLLPERQVTDYKLYYLGGQSNMDGFGFVEALPEAYQGVVDGVMIYRGQTAPDNTERGGAGFWEVLQPGFGLGYRSNGYNSWHSDRFGPELTFGHRIAALNPESRIAIVKYSRGGTPLHGSAQGYGNWQPDNPGLNQYDFALRTLHESRRVADIDGDGRMDRLVPTGIIWMQGEADAYDSEQAADAYQANLTRMMDLFRAALGQDDLPVVIGQITDSGMAEDGSVMDWADTVRAAQERFVESDACASLVTATNDFEYPDDDAWHYTSEGYLTMGIAFADAVDRLAATCTAQSH